MESEAIISAEAKQVTRAAALISAGNVSSRALGLIREMVKSYFFGAGGAVSAFDVAAQVPTMFYDLLIGGMLSSALVPVFSDYTRPHRRAELWKLLSLLISLLVVFLGSFTLILEATAPIVARLLSAGLEPTYLKLAEQMIRITTPAILFVNIAGVLSGALYALQRFERPAFTGAVSNAAIVITVFLLGRSWLGASSLAVGLLAGSIAQVAYQWQGLQDARLAFVSPFQGHPALRTIGSLFLPIALGLIVDQAAVVLSFNLASRTGPSGIAWMKYAATLVQFPLGMVVTAVSVAILPTLSRYATDAEEALFSATLAQGLRLVLILVLPATMAMLILAEPLVALLFQRGNFLIQDTQAVATALRFSLLGLIFSALDQPLIFAFYARKDTWTPALVGMVTVIIYTGLALLPVLFWAPNLSALILANSLKLTLHALLMMALFSRKVGRLRAYGVLRPAILSIIASLLIAVPMAGLSFLVKRQGPGGSLGALLQVALGGGCGAVIYMLLMRIMRLEEFELLHSTLLHRFRT
ncbi:MAG: murein biosynthesis integral membrane protein MurJ, partial [Anaerolineae bacterium]|nr:murein biosynthesis integral membrane protein MurJ [Anaerolineae bacterium]